jgi:hypothetical protein
MFSTKDRKYFKANDISLQKIKEQLYNFKNGFPKAHLERAAIPEDGIIQADEETINKFIENYNYNIDSRSIYKMIPASGAASRMFQQLYDFRESYTGSAEEFLEYHTNQEPGSMYYFFQNLHLLPFYQELSDNLMQRGYYIDQLLEKCQFKFIIDEILTEDGLQYGDMPKGLIKFHSHKEAAVTPMEEHLVEAAHYCRNTKGNSYLHFTVSEEHLKSFKNHLKKNRKRYEKKYDTKFKVSFSVQKKSTDSIAIDFDNNIIRNEKNLPILRQSGHGALIENLNDIKADIVFIKNIDNVLPDRLKPVTYRYKKLIAGMLFSLQDKCFEYLKILEKSKVLTKDKLQEILTFTSEKLYIKHTDSLYYLETEELAEYLFSILNRPMRVCGMVINKGEPGGGPFWIKNENKTESLQIIEKSQIDTKDKKQKAILDSATHFNPVDLVCAITNYKGKKFNLLDYVDKSTGFITEKNYKGTPIKGQELPGLWNGAMANWITVFVEVPIETFAPVKTIQDLFKIEHRNMMG